MSDPRRHPSDAALTADAMGPAEPVGERTAGTLRALLERAGSATVRPLITPAGLDAPVRGTVIHDPSDVLPPSPGALLLLVGTDVAEPRAGAVLWNAVEQGFSGVVVKRRGHDAARFVEEADRCGIAVLDADDTMPWRDVDAVLSCALAAYSIGAAAGFAPAGGEELFALADTVAVVAGGSVAIEDLDQHVVAYSNTPGQRIDALRERGILQRRVPDAREQRRQYQQVLAADGVVRFPRAGEELARAAVAVRAGALPLGTLWAIEPEDGLSEEAQGALADAARHAAPHLLQALNSPAADRRLRRDTLRAALEGPGPPTEESAELLGLRPGAEFCVTAFAQGTSSAIQDTGLAALIPHIESVLVRYCAAHRVEATVAATANIVYVLLPTTSAEQGQRFADATLTAVRTAVGSADVRAAVTHRCTTSVHLTALRREADDILRATIADRSTGTVATVDDTRHRILLDRLGDELDRDPWLRQPGIGELLEHDREHGTDYAATIIAWMDAAGNIASAASLLKVHPNTLRHRLQRIRELFRIDLDHPDVRLAAWLELRQVVQAAPTRRPR